MHTRPRLKRLLLLLTPFTGLLLFIGITNLAANESSDQFLYLPVIQKPYAPPEVVIFKVEPTITDPGETVTLIWQTTHAPIVVLYHMLPTLQLGTFWEVGPSGSMTYTIAESARNVDRFALYVGNEDEGFFADASVTLRCPYDWFFANAPDICAQDAAIISPAAEQPFEHGWMIWVQEEDAIYVLYNDTGYTTRWDRFTDEWDEGEPIDDPSLTPPPGLSQPQRGFGLVWREQPLVRDRLGWALTPEMGYTTAVQRTSYPKYNETYLQAYDSLIWRLLAERSGWEKISPGG